MNDKIVEGLKGRVNLLTTENDYQRLKIENYEKEIVALKENNEEVRKMKIIVEHEKKELDNNNKRHQLEVNQLVSTNQSLTLSNDKLKARVSFYENWGIRLLLATAAVLAFGFYLYYRA